MNDDLMMNSRFAIQSTSWQKAQRELTEVRTQVFMQEQDVSAADEWDGKDETAIHFLVRNPEGEAIGCARILTEIQHINKRFHIDRVAVLRAWRQRGIGHKLMQTLIAWCKQQGPEYPIYLHAQTTRIAFYNRLGFVSQGDVFMDAGIPHIEMWYKSTD